MKTILVPTDFSENAYQALFYATQLFKNYKSHFILLNTFSVNTPMLTSRLNLSKGEDLYKKLSLDSNKKLTEVYHKITRDSEGLDHTFETVSISQPLTETIEKTIKSKDVSLVVMGTKGATGAKEVLLGSNTVKVIQSIKHTPVLAVPFSAELSDINRVVFASNFEHPYTVSEMKKMLDILQMFCSKIDIIYVGNLDSLSQLQKTNLDLLQKILKDYEINIIEIPESGKVSQAITQFIENGEIDLLSMLYYRHGLMESLTREAVIKKMGFKVEIPFLVMPSVN